MKVISAYLIQRSSKIILIQSYSLTIESTGFFRSQLKNEEDKIMVKTTFGAYPGKTLKSPSKNRKIHQNHDLYLYAKNKR